jgi:hypothetical protein
MDTTTGPEKMGRSYIAEIEQRRRLRVASWKRYSEESAKREARDEADRKARALATAMGYGGDW